MELQNLPWYGQMLVFLLIGAIFLGIYYFVYYSDGQAKLKTMDGEISNLETEIRALEQKSEKIEQIKKEIAAKEQTLEKLKEILPEKKEISQILKKIQSLITSSRLRINTWTTMSEQKRDVYVEVPIKINLDGNYHNLGMFFDQLSKLKKIFTVSNLTLAPLSGNLKAFSIKADFVASTYTFSDSNTAAAKGGKK